MDGIFIHASWRSSGTFLWQALRDRHENMAFYEPLHEFLPAMSTRRIRAINPGNWQSHHPQNAPPYFAEYAPLLRPTIFPGYRKNLPLADPEFAFDRYFLTASDQHPALKTYITSLCQAAQAQSRRPVLKFARSQGRLPWFVQNFPDVTHALLIRQPWTQFRSAWRCMNEDENPYFVAAPFMVLERNAADPDVATLLHVLGLPVIPSVGPPLRRLKSWLRGIWAIDPLTIYKASLALWLLNVMHAVPADVMLLDGDASSAEIAAPFGLDIGDTLRPATAPLPHIPGLTLTDVHDCHEAAYTVCAAYLDAPTRNRLKNWIAAAETEAARDLPTASRLHGHALIAPGAEPLVPALTSPKVHPHHQE
jgi:hypothetical protein